MCVTSLKPYDKPLVCVRDIKADAPGHWGPCHICRGCRRRAWNFSWGSHSCRTRAVCRLASSVYVYTSDLCSTRLCPPRQQEPQITYFSSADSITGVLSTGDGALGGRGGGGESGLSGEASECLSPVTENTHRRSIAQVQYASTLAYWNSNRREKLSNPS